MTRWGRMNTISEVYCQLEGKVYISERRKESNAGCSPAGCAFSHGSGLCKDLNPADERICVLLKIIWKELKANE